MPGVTCERRVDGCICMVGTELWWRVEGRYELDHGWSEHISDAWDKAAVEEILIEVPEVTMQAEEWHPNSRAATTSRTTSMARSNRSPTSAKGESCRPRSSIRRAVSSICFPTVGKGRRGRLPARELAVPPDSVITAGDTGNDLDMMRDDLGFRCIAVGNATEELRRVNEPQSTTRRRLTRPGSQKDSTTTDGYRIGGSRMSNDD